MIRALGILACVVVVACNERLEDYTLASASTIVEPGRGIADNNDIYPPSETFSGCDCQRGHWGRELQASLCSAESINGPWVRECFYVRGTPIYWANEKRDAGPL